MYYFVCFLCLFVADFFFSYLCNLRNLWMILFSDPPHTTSAANRPAHLTRDHFSLRKHTQKVSAEDLVNVLLAIAALQQFISNVRHHRFITRAFGEIIRAIKVRS